MDKREIRGAEIQLQACSKTYDNQFQALKPTSLTIKRGETLVLLGPSGCGKTTLLRSIAGLEEIDKGGAILFDGEDITSLPINKRNIGMVFQSYALFPNMNVYDNIAYGLKIQKLDKKTINKRVHEMLEMMNITDFASRKISQLSGGQRQRVALARAIIIQPRVLLLDEPLSALDALLRNSLRVEINRLLKSLGITAIYVTHDQSEAMALGDRIVVMQNGEISQIGTPFELYHKPANNFTAEFVGSINKLEGTHLQGEVIAKGHTFKTKQKLEDGKVDILFRPEDVIITHKETSKFSGKFKDAIFLGSKTSLILDIGEDREVLIETKKYQQYTPDEIIYFDIEDDALILLAKVEKQC